MRFTLLIFLFLMTSDLFALECENQLDEMGNAWVKGPIRRQAGGYIFYRGKSTSSKRFLSELRSDGSALERVEVACGKIPSSTRIIEKCVELRAEGIVSYSRASFLEKDCKSKKINKALTQRLAKYNNYLSSTVEKTCSKKTPSMCIDLQELEYDLGNYENSMKLAIKGCDLSIGELCVRAALIYSYDIKKFQHLENNFSKKYIRKGCKTHENPIACIILLTLRELKESDEVSAVVKTITEKRNTSEFVNLWVASSLRRKDDKEVEVLGNYCKKGYISLCSAYISNKLNLVIGIQNEKIAKANLNLPYAKLCMIDNPLELKMPPVFRDLKMKKNKKNDKKLIGSLCKIASLKSKSNLEKARLILRKCQISQSHFLCYHDHLKLLQRNCRNFPKKLTNKSFEKISNLMNKCLFYSSLPNKHKKPFEGMLSFLKFREQLGSENFTSKMRLVLDANFDL